MFCLITIFYSRSNPTYEIEIFYINKERNDNLPRICQIEIEVDSTSCKVSRAGVNLLVSFTSLL